MVLHEAANPIGCFLFTPGPRVSDRTSLDQFPRSIGDDRCGKGPIEKASELRSGHEADRRTFDQSFVQPSTPPLLMSCLAGARMSSVPPLREALPFQLTQRCSFGAPKLGMFEPDCPSKNGL